MADKTTFPISTGLLCQKHRDTIGTAIWEFLWLIDRTTREQEDSGDSWGIVLGGKPIKAEELAADFNVHPETIKKNLRRLEKGQYIKTTRTQYGMVIYVRKSIKFMHRQSKPIKKREEIPNNQQIIAELVQKYRAIPGLEEQKGDYPFIGRTYNQYGYDLVLDAINKLHFRATQGFKPDDPLLYLMGILKGGNNGGTSGRYPKGQGAAAAAKGAVRPGHQPSTVDWGREGDRI